ncbi:phosphatidylserine decarboxylase family protein [Thermoplasmatales archaeon ex4572_165]|nr:MAG: phosphatidylserine decarboxylase family protein [Thermoplasmatales archaeon ex4572_165]
MECFFLMFFRDPHRKIGKEIVAVADGVIREVNQIKDDDIGDSFHISTFMNVYHVHVNRMPLDGTIKKVTHISGGHIPAFKKESDRNERMITIIETAIGPVKIIQIAGSIARRIVSYVDVDQNLKKGTRIGIIKLGSRVDLIVPKDAVKKISVKKGDRVRAGNSQICSIQ